MWLFSTGNTYVYVYVMEHSVNIICFATLSQCNLHFVNTIYALLGYANLTSTMLRYVSAISIALYQNHFQ